jgi:uncharacterized repeat protein (TIGR03803 family)
MKLYRPLVSALLRNWCFLFAAVLVGLVPSRAGALSFSTLSAFNGTNGAQPVASLLRGADGNFYGTTSEGGLNGYGTIFRATPAGLITTLVSFDSTNNGAAPFGPLVQGADGNFYGTASAGGAYGSGTVFMLSASNTLSVLVSFAGTNGLQPRGRLVSGTNGNFYGTTYAGGDYNLGTVFMVSSNGTLSTVLSFNGTTNGAYPIGGLTAGASGNFYGTASAGGTYNAGTVFRFSLASSSGSSTNGSTGTNTNGTGTVTNSSSGFTFTNLHVFTGGTDGAGPQAALLLAADGSLYGTTSGGGSNNVNSGGNGIVFKLTTSGTFTNLFSFARTNGSGPAAPLVQGADGKLYGTTRLGAGGNGTAFSISTAGAFTLLHVFSGGTGGSDPHYAGLTQGTDYNFYGVTSLRGSAGGGTLYRIAGFAPYVLRSSVSQTVPVGSTVMLGVSVGGSPTLNYHWLRNGNYLKDGSTFSGTSTDTLTIANASTQNSGSYTVVIRNSAGAVTNTAIVLSVRNPYGTNQPTLRITGPANHATLKKAMVTLSGTTSCSVPVDQVYYQVNDGGWQLATSQGGWKQWNAKLVLPPGANTIQAFALNIVGVPSLTNTVNLVVGVTSAPVVVRISGAGTVSPNYDQQWLNMYQSWRMTARPQRGYVFSNWVATVASNTPVFLDSALLKFSPQSNLVFQANFIPSPFLPVSGSFNGLFYDTNGVAPQSAGFMTLNLLESGAFSGRLQLGAARYALSGQFDLSGVAQVTISTAKPEPLQLALQLDLSGGSEQITGSISATNWTAELVAARAPFDGRTNLASQAGRYTLVLPSNAADTNKPGGASYGILTVDTAGRLRFAGALADGTKVTQSTQIGRLGQWPLYASLYKGGGLLLGACVVSNSTNASLSGEVTWNKPALTNATYYPGGFTVITNVLGSRYTPPLGTANPLSFTQAGVVLSGGDLARSITRQVVVGSNNRVSVLDGPGLSLSFTPATGLLRGTAVISGEPKPRAFGGVVLQEQNEASGWFLGGGQSGLLLLVPQSATP